MEDTIIVDKGMPLFIKVENGQPIDHPVFGGNLLQFYETVPDFYQPFVRVEKPTIGPYQVFNSQEPTYQFVNGVWTDIWDIRDMTAEEKQTKIDFFLSLKNDGMMPSDWVFDEVKCKWQPPSLNNPGSPPDVIA
jgi:hypothetical protein